MKIKIFVEYFYFFITFGEIDSKFPQSGNSETCIYLELHIPAHRSGRGKSLQECKTSEVFRFIGSS